LLSPAFWPGYAARINGASCSLLW